MVSPCPQTCEVVMITDNGIEFPAAPGRIEWNSNVLGERVATFAGKRQGRKMPSNRRVRDPYARWCERTGVSHPLLLDLKKSFNLHIYSFDCISPLLTEPAMGWPSAISQGDP